MTTETEINQQVLVILLRKILEVLSIEEKPIESVDIDNFDVIKAHLHNELSPVIKSIKDGSDKSDILKAIKELSKSLKAIEFKPTINVAGSNIPDVIVPEIKIPEINVPAPQVTVNTPEITIPAPIVNVPTPIVTVAAPIVNVPEVDLTEIINELDIGLRKLRQNNMSNPVFVRITDLDRILNGLTAVQQATKEVMLGFPGAIRIQSAGGGMVDFNNLSVITSDDFTKQQLFDYVGGTNAIYQGIAARGLSTSANGWLLRKFTYDGNGNTTQIQIAYNTWAARTTATYA